MVLNCYNNVHIVTYLELNSTQVTFPQDFLGTKKQNLENLSVKFSQYYMPSDLHSVFNIFENNNN